jgi:AAA+ ATPase superfamily predicted ATPase
MFVGRELELWALRERFGALSPSISVVYGRRRIGKSSLIEEASRGFRFYSFEGLENSSSREQREVFAKQLASYGVAVPKDYPRDWFSLLKLLKDLVRESEETVILFDEFQWLANYRNELVSNLKLVWDQYLRKISGLKLVLCGSVASFMVRKVLRSKALYGRVDLSIHLKPFSLIEAKQMFPNRSTDELILAYLFVGGVPKYLSLLRDRDSILRSLQFHCSREMDYFPAEYDKIFVSHFGDNQIYSRIVRFLAHRLNGASRLEIIEEFGLANSGQTTELLADLEYSGFIRAVVPFDKNLNSNQKRFYLADYYLRFYLTFIEPLIKRGELDSVDFINQVFHSPKMTSWLGYSFESMCLDHAQEFAKILGFSAVRYRYGPYFQAAKREGSRLASQLDLVFDRQDRVCTVCEIKYQDRVDLKQAGEEMDRAISRIRYLDNKTINKVLITSGDLSESKNNHLYFSRIINISEILLSKRGFASPP